MTDKMARRIYVRNWKFRSGIKWLAFLNTVRTEAFEDVLAARPALEAVLKAA